MKRITMTTLGTAIGLDLFQLVYAFAEDQGQKETGKAKKETVQAKSGVKTAKAGTKQMASSQAQVTTTTPRKKGSTARSDKVIAQQNNTAVRRSSRSVTNQTVINQNNFRTFNRTNNYGGRWFAGGAHPGWDRGSMHSWGGHQWRWFDGGWLIIDGGFWPPAYYGPSYTYSNRDYGYASNSTVRDVQRKLGDLGYYNGYADGVLGPVTHNAIANYQRDHGMAVTGRINNPLLASLGLS